MPRDLCRSWPVLAVLTCVMGCAGNGEGLDANGQPIMPGNGGGSSGPITADFQSIQDNVFTPICSKCHIGASAPEGLQLDAAHSYNLLVGVPSVEEPNLLRVNPGNPDQSYMVLKIEGASGIEGGQMPLGETPLPQDTINAIRQWISNGAPKDGASAAQTASLAFEVEATSPLDSSVLPAPVRQIVVTFSQELDATYITDRSVTLQRLDGPIPMDVPLRAAQAARNASVMLVTPLVPLREGVYRATVHGSGDAAVAKLGSPLLGEGAANVGSRVPGGEETGGSRLLGTDRTFQFTVERAP
jgi:hypothetical protein